MKKFLFTLAAMLMSASAFANCYLYVDPEVNLEDLKGQGEQIISLKAHFDVYCSAWQLRFDIPQGVTITYAEPGADMKVSYKNARGKDAVVEVALASNDDFTEYMAAIMTAGYWQDPNSENPEAWVTYGVIKWEPGDYDNMVDLYIEVDDTYEGGDLVVWTTPSSGTDTRGATCKDNGDEAREQTVPEDQPVEKIDVAAPVISTTMDATTVTVNIEWPTTDGEHMYNGQYTYERPAYGEAAQSYDVEAYTTETETYKESVHATYTVEVPAQDPVWQDVVAPVITPTVNATTVTVEITWPTSDGEKVYTGQYTYDRPAYGEADQTYQVEAYTTEKYPYRESAHATATINVPAQDPVWQAVAAPVITTTMDDENVYVTIEWPTTTGNHVYTGQYTYPRGEQDATYDVEAYTEADYPYSESTHATFTVQVPAKEQVTPPEPGETKTFVKVTAADQLVAGKNYIIVAGSKAMGVAATGNFLAPVDITAGDEVEVGDDVAIMTLGGTLNHYTLALGDQYLTAGNSTNLAFGATATEWAIADYNGTLDGYRVKHADYNRAVRYSSGYNRFGNYSTSDQNSEYAWIYVEKTETPEPTVWADPVVVVDDAVSEDGFLYATITWEEGATLYIDGEAVVGVTSPYRYKIAAQSLQDQEGSFFVQAKGDGRDDSQNVRVAWTLPARVATYAPAPELVWDEATFTMSAVLNERAAHNIVMMKDGIVCENPYTVTQTYAPQTIMFSAYTEKNGEDYNSETVYKEVTVPAKEKSASTEPTIAVTEGDEAYVITGQGTGTVVMYDAEGNEIANPYTVTRTDEQQVIIITVENTDADTEDVMYKPTSKTFTVIVPAKVVEQWQDVAAPVITTTMDENNVYVQVAWPTSTGEQIFEGEYTYPRGDEDYSRTVVAYTTENYPYRESAHATLVVSVPKKVVTPPTSIEEILNSENVASVRYFNMAGQEMQEAEGMTIVVVTYTNGTTSAIKVMK